MFCIFAVQITNFTCLCILYVITITHPMITLTNLWIHGAYTNIHDISGGICHTSGECAVG
jgi:accessory gene regulator protein AgrB